MEATNTFLDSIDSQDPDKIQHSARRLSELRASVSGATPRTQQSSWTGATPYAFQTPYDTPLHLSTPRRPSSPSSSEASKPKINADLSLDAFQAKYTSEDNSSFTEILDDENRLRKQKYAWAWEAERKAGERKLIEVHTRERLLIEATGGASSSSVGPQKTIEGHELLLVEDVPVSVGDGGDGQTASTSQALIVSTKGKEKELADKSVDVMAKRKDTRTTVVPTWKFRVRFTFLSCISRSMS